MVILKQVVLMQIKVSLIHIYNLKFFSSKNKPEEISQLKFFHLAFNSSKEDDVCFEVTHPFMLSML